MFYRALRWAISWFTTMIVLYVVFFVPLGQRTIWEHVKRIAGTPEAREFGQDMAGASQRVAEKARHEVLEGFPVTTRDAGADARHGAR